MGIFQRILMACGQDKPGVAGWRLKPARVGSGSPDAQIHFLKKNGGARSETGMTYSIRT